MRKKKLQNLQQQKMLCGKKIRRKKVLFVDRPLSPLPPL